MKEEAEIRTAVLIFVQNGCRFDFQERMRVVICGLQRGRLPTQLIDIKRHDLEIEGKEFSFTLRSSGTNEEWISILCD
jgi:hypothetical protein